MRVSSISRILFVSAIFLAVQACWGQSFSFGVKAGGRSTGDIVSQNSATSESKRYLLGPMLELGLPLGLSLEVDALYQRQGYRSGYSSFLGTSINRVRANAWEVPVLLKYKLPTPFRWPYIEAGVVPRLMNGAVTDASGYSIDLQTRATTYSQSHGAANWPNSVGTVFGGGMQFGLGSLRLAPEIRYTRWNSTPLNQFGSYGFEFHSAQNQVDLLVGISWKVGKRLAAETKNRSNEQFSKTTH